MSAVRAAGPLTATDGRTWPLPGTPDQAALVVVDVQRSFADPAYLPWLDASGAAAVAGAVATTARLVDEARRLGVAVVWVALEQQPDAPWQTSLWLRGTDAGSWPGPDEPCVAGTAGAEWFGLAPGPGETVVTKTRYSGFVGTDLEDVLTSLGATWLVVTGLTTECCVGSTVWDAFQRGWRTVVVSDATAAYDPAVHAHTLGVLAENVAVVAGADEVLAALAAAPAARELTGAGA